MFTPTFFHLILFAYILATALCTLEEHVQFEKAQLEATNKLQREAYEQLTRLEQALAQYDSLPSSIRDRLDLECAPTINALYDNLAHFYVNFMSHSVKSQKELQNMHHVLLKIAHQPNSVVEGYGDLKVAMSHNLVEQRTRARALLTRSDELVHYVQQHVQQHLQQLEANAEPGMDIGSEWTCELAE